MDFVYVSKVNSFILSAWRGANPNASRNPPLRRPRHAEGSYYFPRGSRPSHPRVSRPYAATVCRHVRNNPRPVCQSARGYSPRGDGDFYVAPLARFDRRACRKFLRRSSILEGIFQRKGTAAPFNRRIRTRAHVQFPGVDPSSSGNFILLRVLARTGREILSQPREQATIYDNISRNIGTCRATFPAIIFSDMLGK